MQHHLQSKLIRNLSLLILAISLQLTSGELFAQTDSVYWDFGTTTSPTSLASVSSNSNVSAGNCVADTGNVCCTPFTTGGYSIPYLTIQYSSTNVGAYSGASGQPTIRNNCKSGGFNASTSTYLSFTVKPNSGYAVTIKEISFGAQGVFFGPSAYTIRTSVDAYTSTIASGSLGSDYGGAKKVHAGLTVTGNASSEIEVRVYAHGGFFTANTGDFFMDDVTIKYTVAAAGCSGTPTPGTVTANNTTYCGSGAPELTLSSSSSGNGISHQWYASANGTSYSAISGATNISYSSSTLTDTTYFYCETTCSNSSMSANSDTVVVNVADPLTNIVTIVSSDTTLCAGTEVVFSALPPANTNPTVNISGATLTNTAGSMNSTSSCVGSGGFWSNSWTGSAKYWQYKISTVGYEDIVFNTPTSSSGTGPHNGSVSYSTDGSNFTQVTTYNWSGTGCTSTGNISLPAAANNQTDVYVRLYMSGASSSSGTNRVNRNAFKGKAIQAGVSPTYQWKKNGTNVGIDSNKYVDNSLANGDEVHVEVAAGVCATPDTFISDTITVNVNPILTPNVVISSTDTTICSGASVIFTAAPTNGGSSPDYQWKVNGNNVGTNSNTYTSSVLSNNDVVTCELTSNATCLAKTKDTSNSITMIVNPLLDPSVIISSTDTTICSGTSVTFTAAPTNGGSSPDYQWKVNGNNVGTNSSTYTSSGLNNNDAVTCEITSNATCLAKGKDTSNSITMTVNPLLTASVAISAGNSTICNGTSVTLTATPTNGGASPTYQWKVNGSNAGTNSNTFSSSTLSNNDVITCEMTSNATCLAKGKDTSNAITMTVNPLLTVSVTISAGNNTICNGTSVTFTATPTNGGASPTYQWKVNGSNAGTNSSTFSSSTLSNNDVITCEMTSNATCLAKGKDTSNAITMTVNPLLTASVTISAGNSTICNGTSVTFTATPTNGGASPSYQWKVNGSNAGTNSSTFSSSTLSNNDVITCEMTSNATCLAKGKDTSNAITMTVNPLLTPSVSISSTDTTICAGTSVIFTAAPTNGGTTPIYQWKVNGSNVGTNSTTYTNPALNNNDIVVCEMESSATCVTKAKDTSSNIVMVVNPILTPTINITVSPNDTVCSGTAVTFTSMTTFGGSNPGYQWQINGGVVSGAVNNTWTSTTLSDGDVVTCELTSNATCAIPAKDTSNDIKMSIIPSIAPKVSVSVLPGTKVEKGTVVTYNAIVSDAGTSPSYQWQKNHNDIAGETNSSYVTSNLADQDIITVRVSSSEVCANPTNITSQDIVMTITVGVRDIENGGNALNIYPNPNSGTFTLVGSYESNVNQEMAIIEVVNSVGAVIYKQTGIVQHGELKKVISLENNMPSGLYLVRTSIANKVHTLKFLVNR